MAAGEMIGDRGEGDARGEPVAALATSVSAAYADHADSLRSFLTRCTRDAGAAEDLVHETFVRLLTEVAGGRTPVHLRAWLFRVAANLAASRGRHHGVIARRTPELVAARDIVRSPEDELLDREAVEAIELRLAHLPPHVRRALFLAAEGYSGAEIARSIGRSELATRSLLCRYRGRLRSGSAAA